MTYRILLWYVYGRKAHSLTRISRHAGEMDSKKRLLFCGKRRSRGIYGGSSLEWCNMPILSGLVLVLVSTSVVWKRKEGGKKTDRFNLSFASANTFSAQKDEWSWASFGTWTRGLCRKAYVSLHWIKAFTPSRYQSVASLSAASNTCIGAEHSVISVPSRRNLSCRAPDDRAREKPRGNLIQWLVPSIKMEPCNFLR